MTESIYTFKKDVFPYDELSLEIHMDFKEELIFKIKTFRKYIIPTNSKGKTKNGIVKTDKKIYCDLLFDKDDEGVIEFLTELEDKIKN